MVSVKGESFQSFLAKSFLGKLTAGMGGIYQPSILRSLELLDIGYHLVTSHINSSQQRKVRDIRRQTGRQDLLKTHRALYFFKSGSKK